MIEYTKTEADSKNRIRDFTWAAGCWFIIFSACILPFSAYFFIAGWVGDAAEALKMGWQTLTVAVVMLAAYVILYLKYRKAVNTNFDKYAEEDKIDFTLEETDEGALLFTRLTDEETFEIKRSDIKHIKRMKSINIIVLRSKKTVDLPRREDIDKLLEKYC